MRRAIPAPRSSAAASAVEADAAATARIFTSSCMWNITRPPQDHRRERQPHRQQREPRELQAHRRQQPQRQRERDPRGERAQRDDEGELGHGVNR